MMHIVILRALGLGDFLTGVPAYRAVRRKFANALITLAASRALEPLFPLIGGVIDAIADTHELATLPRQTFDADVGIDLHGCGPESHRLLLATRPRRLIAFRHAEIPASFDGPSFDPNEHEVRRWCRLLDHAAIPADPLDLDLQLPADPVPHWIRGATLIHPGAASEARRWPVERWAAVARAEQRTGRSVIITGSESEAARTRSVAQMAGVPATHVFAGQTNVRQLAALVAASGRVVCGDTGVAHLATAYRRPSVLLFGPTAPSRWGPPSRAYHRVLWHGTTGNPHGDRIDPGLCAIRVERVIEALNSLPAA